MTLGITDRKWLLLPIETKFRELDGKLLLACMAASRGWGVIVGGSEAVRKNQHLYPQSVLIEVNITAGQKRKTELFLRKGNIVTAWCEEGLVYRNRDDYFEQRVEKGMFDLVSRFFSWGDIHKKDIISKLGYGQEKILPVGNPRFDLLRPELRNFYLPMVSQIKQKYGSIILVNTNFKWANHYLGCETVLPELLADGKIKNNDQLFKMQAEMQFQKIICKHFTGMIPGLADAFPDHTIIIRPHPSENLNYWKEVADGLDNVQVTNQGNVIPWILAAEITIHNGCTTGIESFLLDRPAIAFRPYRDADIEMNLPNQLSVEAEDTDILKNLVGKKLAGGSLMSACEYKEKKEMASTYIASVKGELACGRILDALEEMELPDCSFLIPVKKNLSYRIQAFIYRIKYFLPALKKKIYMLLQGKFVSKNQKQKYKQIKFPALKLAEVKDFLSQLIPVVSEAEHLSVEQVEENVICIFRS